MTEEKNVEAEVNEKSEFEGYTPFNFINVIDTSIKGCDENMIAAKAQKQLLQNIRGMIEKEGIIFLKPEEKKQ